MVTAGVLVWLLSGQRQEFADALSSASLWVLGVTALLQIVALVSRSEAWHLTIGAAGGTVDRRVLYRASSMQVLGSVVNGNPGVAARIAASVAILGGDGVAAAAAAGVLMTVTGTIGGACFAVWAAGDRLWSAGRRAAPQHE